VLIEQSQNPPQSNGEFLCIGKVPRINVMAEAEPVFSVQHIAQTDLP